MLSDEKLAEHYDELAAHWRAITERCIDVSFSRWDDGQGGYPRTQGTAMSDQIERPADAADPTYPDAERCAQTLENCEDDLLTEAQFVRWQGQEIERLTAALHAQPGPVSMDDVEWAGKVHLAEAIRERDELRRQLAEAQKEIHNLNWALGTDGYAQMATPEEQAEHEKAVRAHHDVLARLEEGKRAYEAMKRDARRYRWLRDDGTGFEITVREEDEDGHETWVSGYPPDELNIAIDAAMGGGDAG